ncbi:MAG: serpin family protein [Endomicrobia bacterium]|nr:serpin family protein [Endomicrobiia bacterium]
MPRKIFLFFTLALCFCCLSSNTAAASGGSNKFAVELYKKLTAQNDKANIFFSPYSIYSAFCLLYEGAAGKTAKQLQGIFGFNPDPSERHMTMRAEISSYRDLYDGYGISIANSIWVNKKFTVRHEYSSVLKHHYFAQSFNFINADKINRWVSEKTFGRIKNIVDSSANNAQVILANAIYFKAKWFLPFEKELTAKSDFFINDNSKIAADMMRLQDNFSYYENEKVRVLRMKYRMDNKNMSMTSILPKQNKISEAENFLYGNGLEQLSFEVLNVSVFFPKFKLDWENSELMDIIEKMGLSNFSPDYSGISKDPLAISKVIHKAFIEVSEKETEAAAATAIMMRNCALPPKHEDMPKIFKADHPFVYMITDDDNGKILFLGKMMNPAQSN